MGCSTIIFIVLFITLTQGLRALWKGAHFQKKQSLLEDLFSFFFPLFLLKHIFFGYFQFVLPVFISLYFLLFLSDLFFGSIYGRQLTLDDFRWIGKNIFYLHKSILYELKLIRSCSLFFCFLLGPFSLFLYPVCTDCFILVVLAPFFSDKNGWGINPLIHLFKNRFRKKEKKISPSFNFSFFLSKNEKFEPVDPQFPLLRKTIGFEGKELFCLENKRPNIVILALESFGMRDLEACPFFNELCKEGVFFNRFFSNTPVSSPSAISTLYSAPVFQKDFSYQKMKKIPYRGMPEIFKELGYSLANITSTYANGSEEFFYDSSVIDHFADRQSLLKNAKNQFVSSFMVDDRLAYEDLITFMDRNHEANTPSFAYFSSGFGHHPWEIPSGFQSLKKDTHHEKLIKALKVSDSRLEEFFKKIQMKKWYQDTLFIIQGDHGQPLGEHQNNQIRLNVYQENVHVPLLFLKKGDLEPQLITNIGSQVDILPTLIHLLKLKNFHHSTGYPLSIHLFDRNVLLGNFGIRADYGIVEWPYKVSTHGIFDLNLDPYEKCPISEITTPIKNLESKMIDAIEMIQYLNESKSWSSTIATLVEIEHFTKFAQIANTLKESKNNCRYLSIEGQPTFFLKEWEDLQRVESLKYLKIQSTLLPFNFISSLLRINAQLESLYLSHVYAPIFEFDSLTTCKKLKKLFLKNIEIDHEALFNFIESSSTWLELSLEGMNLNKTRFMQALKNCKNLKKLHTDLPLADIDLEMLSCLEEIESLSLLDASQITKKGFIHLKNFPLFELKLYKAHYLKEEEINTIKTLSLQNLVLESNSLNDENLSLLKEMSLEQLSLNYCKNISEQGLIRFTSEKGLRLLILMDQPVALNTHDFRLTSIHTSGHFTVEKKCTKGG